MRNKKLYRDPERALICGVVAGLANYTGLDLVLLRLLVILGLILTGFFPIVIVYLMAWIFVPLKMEPGGVPEYVVHEEV